MTVDSQFVGSIPALYEELLVPVLFRPYAEDIVRRAVALDPANILEIAAGTGIVSHGLAAALPAAGIVATDLNAAMLDVAARAATSPNLSFQPADAQSLPFADGQFDLVVAQFGAMFFPDKIGAYREARRVLAPGGTLLFNVWGPLEANSGAAAVQAAIREGVPEPKPQFLARTPYGYHDAAQIRRELGAAGFTDIAIETVTRLSPSGSAALLARGLCLGSPVANELAAHATDLRERALADAISAAEQAEQAAPLTMAALVVSAR